MCITVFRFITDLFYVILKKKINQTAPHVKSISCTYPISGIQLFTIIYYKYLTTLKFSDMNFHNENYVLDSLFYVYIIINYTYYNI